MVSPGLHGNVLPSARIQTRIALMGMGLEVVWFSRCLDYGVPVVDGLGEYNWIAACEQCN